MPSVISSAIARIEHDPATDDLRVWFHESGGPYTYVGVPAGVYRAFLASPSKGRFFNEEIRDRFSARGVVPVLRIRAARPGVRAPIGWR